MICLYEKLLHFSLEVHLNKKTDRKMSLMWGIFYGGRYP